MIFLFSCKPEPEALRYGEDGCYVCKMTLMDKRFGAEVVTAKGKVYKFDDVNCMINFLNTGFPDGREVAYRLVVDYDNSGKLIDAGQAFFLKSPEIKSPMASQVAAFESKDAMEQFKKQWKGIYLTWGELMTQFK
jgi:copper chaperone NosL